MIRRFFGFPTRRLGQRVVRKLPLVVLSDLEADVLFALEGRPELIDAWRVDSDDGAMRYVLVNLHSFRAAVHLVGIESSHLIRWVVGPMEGLRPANSVRIVLRETERVRARRGRRNGDGSPKRSRSSRVPRSQPSPNGSHARRSRRAAVSRATSSNAVVDSHRSPTLTARPSRSRTRSTLATCMRCRFVRSFGSSS